MKLVLFLYVLLALVFVTAPAQSTKPVNPTQPDYSSTSGFLDLSSYPTSGYLTLSVGKNSDTIVSVSQWDFTKGFAADSIVMVNSIAGHIDRLSDDEYAELQKRRAALGEEEITIAKAHGVDFGQVYKPATCEYYDMGCVLWNHDSVLARRADLYEFRGQFLLVNVPANE